LPLSKEDRWEVMRAYIEEFGLTRFHRRSFDDFLENDIRRVIEQNPYVDADVGWRISFLVHDPQVGKKRVRVEIGDVPMSIEFTGTRREVTPLECRLRRLTYAIPVYVYAVIEKLEDENGKRVWKPEDKPKRIRLLLLPIVVGSKYDPYFRQLQREKSKERKKKIAIDLGEDWLDADGGYFIINGSERCVCPREESVRGRIIVEELTGTSSEARKYAYSAWMITRGIYHNKASVYITREDLQIHVTFTQTKKKEPIPLFLLVRALGFTPQQFIRLVAPEEFARGGGRMMEILALNVESVPLEYLRSQEDALYALADYMERMRVRKEERERRIEEVKRRINFFFLSHLGRDESSWPLKGYYLARMVRKLLLVYFGELPPDDRDHYKNKRLKMVGDFLRELFSYAFRQMIQASRKKLAQIVSAKSRVTSETSVLRLEKLQEFMMKSIATGMWPTGVTGVTEVLERLNHLATYSHLRRVKNVVTLATRKSKRGKVEARDVHPTQWGRICPVETPEGELCGLTKQLALMAYVTTNLPQEEIERLKQKLRQLGVKEEKVTYDWSPWPRTPVFIDGEFFGTTDNPHLLVRKIRELRRSGEIHFQISVKYYDKLNEIHITTEGGRILRPLIIVENGKPKLTKEHIEKLRKGVWRFSDLLKNGIIEFLDAEEEEDAYIAVKEEDLTPEHTHLEIAPAAILGISASLIPFVEHNQAPKIVHECSMTRQAMTIPRPNYRLRPETSTFLLTYPQKPLVKTAVADIVGVNERGYGQNAIVAILAYEGYGIEDAVIINKASIERGFMRGYLMRLYDVEERKRIEGKTTIAEKIQVPPAEVIRRKLEFVVSKLDDEGITWPGVYVKEDEVIVGKIAPVPQVTGVMLHRDVSEKVRKGEAGRIDQVILTQPESENALVRVKLRQPRFVEIGDKFASRHGQKGVIGLVVPQEDMPFDEYGIVPDIILNPHSIPSRMTIGQLLESLAGNIAAKLGKQFDATPFEAPNGNWTEYLVNLAKKLGLNYYGIRTLYNPRTGKIMKAHILMGPVYYQRLKHLAADKIHARARGKVTQLTLQPTEGKARGGGLRLGEMERDALIGHGVTQFLRERWIDCSDGVVIYCCECGLIAYYSQTLRRWVCPIHGAKTEIRQLKLPYAFVLLINELMSLGIKVQLVTKPAVE